MAKLSIKIEHRTFDIDVNSDIYDLLAEKIEKDLSLNDNNSLSELLKAYLNQCYLSVSKDKQIDSIVKKLEED
jgi:hypothetical protein